MTQANAHDQLTLHGKRKAITALLPYAVWQERYRQHAMILDVLSHVVNASQSNGFLWHCVQPFVNTLLNDASDVPLKRAVMLVSPCIPWGKWDFREDLIRAWAAIASAIPKEEGVAPKVVNALLQIAYFGLLPPDNHGDIWSWLTLRPSLPPICEGRRAGSDRDVVQSVSNLKDIEILKSYLLLVWSEWDSLWDGFPEMCRLMREDFSGIEMHGHRKDLVQRLDHILRQLGRGLRYLQQDRPDIHEDGLQLRKNQYGKLREILLQADGDVLKI